MILTSDRTSSAAPKSVVTAATLAGAASSPFALARRIGLFALPATAIMLLSGLFLVVDTYFVAGLGESALAGITLVFPLYLTMLTVLGGGIGVGLSVVISVRLGQGETDLAQRSVGSALVLAVALSVLCAIAFALGARTLFAHVSPSPSVVAAAMSFGLPIFVGAPAMAVSLTMTNLLRCEKRLGLAGLMLLAGGVVNAALDPVLIYGKLGLPALGMAGAGIATAVGFAVTAVFGRLFFGAPGRLSLGWRELSVAARDMGAITRIALPTIVTYIANNLVLFVLTALWSRFGTDALAGFGLATRMEYLLVLAIYGLGGAIITFGGEAWGAKDRALFKRVSLTTAVGSMFLGLGLSCVALLRPEGWFAIFGASSSVSAAGVQYLRIAALAYPFYAFGLTLSYSYQTMAQAYRPLVYVLARGFGVAVPWVALTAAANGSMTLPSVGIALSFVVYGALSMGFFGRALRAESGRPSPSPQRPSTRASSPYPWWYTLQWPWYFSRPSTRNHLGTESAPLVHRSHAAAEQNVVRVCALGDIMVMQGDRAPHLSPELVKVLGGADVIIGCCESVVTRTACDPKAKYSFVFTMPSDYLRDIIAQSGTDPQRWYLSVANNHAGDAGIEGLRLTMEYLPKLDVHPVGYRAPGQAQVEVIDTGRLRLGLTAWTRWLNLEVFGTDLGVWRTADVADKPWPTIKRDLELDSLMGSAHWEYEWQHFPRRESRVMAAHLHQQGFDAVIGSHAHVLQPIEWFGDTLCAYNLGNFCSGIGVAWPARMSQLLTMDIGTQGAQRGKVMHYELHLFVQVDDPEQSKLVPVQQAPLPLRRRIDARVARLYSLPAPPLRLVSKATAQRYEEPV